MSLDAMSYVIRHSPYRDSTFLAHLLIADIVNDQHENEFFMAQATLAEKARMSQRSVWNALQRLSADGFLTQLEDNSRAGKPNRYRFEFPQTPVVFEPRVRKICAPVRSDCEPGAQDLRGGYATVADKTKRTPTDRKTIPASCSNSECASGWLWDEEQSRSVACPECNPKAKAS